MPSAVRAQRKADLPCLDYDAFFVIATKLVDHVEFRNMIPQGAVVPDPRWRRTGVVRWIIYIQNLNPPAEQLLTFVHEIVHIFHHLTRFCREEKSNEEWIEADAKRFLAEYGELVGHVFSSVKQ